MSRTEEPTLVLLTGPPGTGKSTLAEHAATRLGAAVLGWDWAMAALTGCEPVQAALDALGRSGHHAVGWSILCNLAEEQLRAGRSVVLDGVARADEVRRVRDVADRARARCVVVLTECGDVDLLRSRVVGRQRRIPGWYELTWEHVAQFLARWEPPGDVDHVVDTGDGTSPAALVDSWFGPADSR